MARFFNVSSMTAVLICSSLSAISTQLSAATVNVSDNLIVSEVNDKTIDNKFLGQKSSFKLNQGNHALVVRYKDVFEDLDFAEDRVVQSQEFVVRFTIKDQERLKLSTTKIKNLAGAESFSKSPRLKLIDGHDNELSLSLEQVDAYKLAKQVDIAVNSLASKQAIQTNGTALATASVVSTQKAENTLIQVNSLVMLKYWWKNASNEEKQRFKQFTKEK